ncbi:hypothetical protein MKSMC1_25680 [Mycobacterium kansasii]|nr:hypothetical protein MKSMC1_25680 [Mycobacterium kansasii]
MVLPDTGPIYQTASWVIPKTNAGRWIGGVRVPHPADAR